MGPTPPSRSMGMRSHHALKMAIVACMRPTLACSATASGRPVTRVYPCASATACSSCTQSKSSGRIVAEVIHQAVVQAAKARAGCQRNVFDIEQAQQLGNAVAAEAWRRFDGGVPFYDVIHCLLSVESNVLIAFTSRASSTWLLQLLLPRLVWLSSAPVRALRPGWPARCRRPIAGSSAGNHWRDPAAPAMLPRQRP